MTTFIILAIVLTIAAIAVVVVPLLKRKGSTGDPAIWSAFAATGVLIFGAAALYAVWSNWSWHPPAETAGTPQAMVSSLARRLERNPEDLEGWLMLGRSYSVLQQYELSERAYQRADRLAGGKNAEAIVGMAEAMALLDEKALESGAAQLFEKALQLDPQSGKALFYSAAGALRRGDFTTARERFAKLLALSPPDNVKAILEQQIAQIDEKLGQKSAPESGSAPAMAGKPGPAASGAAGASGSQPSAAAGAVPPVRVKVTLSDKLKDSVPESTVLFVLVRDPRQAGPPLAVKRLSSQFPQNVELTTGDSMLPGRSFANGQLVEVVARVSRSGSPIGSTGDLFGLAAHRVGEGGVVDIVIEHVTP